MWGGPRLIIQGLDTWLAPAGTATMALPLQDARGSRPGPTAPHPHVSLRGGGVLLPRETCVGKSPTSALLAPLHRAGAGIWLQPGTGGSPGLLG